MFWAKEGTNGLLNSLAHLIQMDYIRPQTEINYSKTLWPWINFRD